MVLNGDHTVVQDLDIYQRVGRGVAHDEVVPISIQSGRLSYRGDESDIQGGKIRVEFIKVSSVLTRSIKHMMCLLIRLLFT